MRLDVTADLANEAQVAAVAAGDELEAGYAASCERMLRRFTRHAVGVFDSSAHFAAEPLWRLPVPAELLNTDAAQAELEEDAAKHREAATRAAGDAAAAQLGVAFDVSNGILEGVIASQSGMHITTAPEELVGVLMESLQKSYDEGHSIPKAAREMRKAGYTHSQGYAARIARTETISAVNGASLGLVRLATSMPYKQWMATLDNRTRPHHADANGQTVPIADSFSVGSSRLDYPGDPSGPGDEIINCRCTLGYSDTPNVNTIAGGSMATLDRTTALRQRAASLAADVAVDEADPVEAGASWSGVIAQEGVDTGDGRRIEPGALGWRTLPLTLMSQLVTPDWGGHTGAEVAGRIDEIARAGEDITASGVFDTGTHGAETERMVRDQTLRGVSVDLAVNEAEIIPDPDIEDEIEAYWMGSLNILDGTILGATVVPFPAFENASIAIIAGAAMRLHHPRRMTAEQLAARYGGEFTGKALVVSFFMPFAPSIGVSIPADGSVHELTGDESVAGLLDAIDDQFAALAATMDLLRGKVPK